MPLKFKLKSKDEVPAELANLYAERDGAFILDVEGAVEKSRLDEFRTNNLQLQKQLQELQGQFQEVQKQFDGIDAEKARELLRKQEDLENQNLIKSGDVEKLVEKRLQTLRAELDSTKTEKTKIEEQLANITINQAALAAATRRGIKPAAFTDLQNRVRTVFRLVNGVPKAFEPDGSTLRFSKDGITPLTLDDWVEELALQASHLFEPSSGGGASSNGSGGAGLIGHGQKNPWKKETWNFTEQCRIARDNPALAMQLRKAAGR